MSGEPTRLESLIYQRDLIEAALGTGSDYVEMTIRGRTVRKSASIDTLKYLNEQIDKEQANAAIRRVGPARNVAGLRR